MPFPQHDGHQTKYERRATFARDKKDERRQRAGAQRRGRGVAGEVSDREPYEAKGERRLPGESEKTAKKGRNAFAAFEFEPDRKKMAEKGPGRSGKHCGRAPDGSGNPYRGGAFGKVEKKGHRGKILPPRAQDIGRADIAGADGPQVRSASRARQNQPEWNRAAKIAEQEGQKIL